MDVIKIKLSFAACGKGHFYIKYNENCAPQNQQDWEEALLFLTLSRLVPGKCFLPYNKYTTNGALYLSLLAKVQLKSIWKNNDHPTHVYTGYITHQNTLLWYLKCTGSSLWASYLV